METNVLEVKPEVCEYCLGDGWVIEECFNGEYTQREMRCECNPKELLEDDFNEL